MSELSKQVAEPMHECCTGPCCMPELWAAGIKGSRKSADDAMAEQIFDKWHGVLNDPRMDDAYHLPKSAEPDISLWLNSDAYESLLWELRIGVGAVNLSAVNRIVRATWHAALAARGGK